MTGRPYAKSVLQRFSRHRAGIYFRSQVHYLFQGQPISGQEAPRGTPAFGSPPARVRSLY